VSAVAIGVWLLGLLILPVRPPMKSEEVAKYSCPGVVAFLESIAFLAVIITLTFGDLLCSVLEMLAMSWLMGENLDPEIKEYAEAFGLTITIWMVVEINISVLAQGFFTFFRQADNVAGYIAVMVDLFFDLFAEDMAGFAGLLLVVRLFKIYRVYQAIQEVDEKWEDLDSQLKQAEGGQAKVLLHDPFLTNTVPPEKYAEGRN
jgi:hypothetical protein